MVNLMDSIVEASLCWFSSKEKKYINDISEICFRGFAGVAKLICGNMW